MSKAKSKAHAAPGQECTQHAEPAITAEEHVSTEPVRAHLSLLTFFNGLDTLGQVAFTKGVAGLALYRARSAHLWLQRMRRGTESKLKQDADNSEILAQIDASLFRREPPLGLTTPIDNQQRFVQAMRVYYWAQRENQLVTDESDTFNHVQAPGDYFVFKLNQAKPVVTTTVNKEHSLAAAVAAHRKRDEDAREYEFLKSATIEALHAIGDEIRTLDFNECIDYVESLTGAEAYEYGLAGIRGLGNQLVGLVKASARSYGEREAERLSDLYLIEHCFREGLDFVVRLDKAYATDIAALPYDTGTIESIVRSVCEKAGIEEKYFSMRVQEEVEPA